MAILSCHVSIKLPPKISDGQQILSVTIFEKTPIFRDCSIVTGGRFEDRSARTGRIDLGPAQCLRVSPQLGERLDPKPNCVGQVPTAR